MITVCLIIAGCLLAVGAGLYFQELRYRKRNPVDVDKAEAKETAAPAENEDPEVCCGQHATCEKTSLVATTVAAPVYYEDEELDSYAGREPESYSEEEEEVFRDILLSLIPEDVAGWARSLQQRNIQLPVAVRDELLMIVDDLRQNNA